MIQMLWTEEAFSFFLCWIWNKRQLQNTSLKSIPLSLPPPPIFDKINCKESWQFFLCRWSIYVLAWSWPPKYINIYLISCCSKILEGENIIQTVAPSAVSAYSLIKMIPSRAKCFTSRKKKFFTANFSRIQKFNVGFPLYQWIHGFTDPWIQGGPPSPALCPVEYLSFLILVMAAWVFLA